MISGKPTVAWAEINEQGQLVIPKEVVERYGLKPGARVRLDAGVNSVRLHRPVTHLTKIYVEPTTYCNLDCITCFRNAWEEPGGRMSAETFAAIVAGLQALDPVPGMYFGGIGEPLFHPRTLDWVAQAKSLGAKVELITNGATLTGEVARGLIDAGLDVLWVSLDGASPEGYADVRLGAEFSRVVENVRRFSRMRRGGHLPRPELGIAFVAMKRNIDELPAVIRLGKSLRAGHFSVSNLQPATVEMQGEILYKRALRDIAYLSAPGLPHLNLPRMDLNQDTRNALFDAFASSCSVTFAGNNWSGATDVCNFVESGTMSIAWNGEASPCWPLLHTHDTFMHGKPHRNHKHVIGNVRERSLQALWLDPEYVAYRERLHNFAFAPCGYCGGCDLSEANLEDCFGNPAPACGVCLWAQGLIQCP